MPATHDYPDLPAAEAMPDDSHASLWQALKSVRRATEKVKQADEAWAAFERELRAALTTTQTVAHPETNAMRLKMLAVATAVPLSPHAFSSESGQGEIAMRERILAALRNVSATA